MLQAEVGHAREPPCRCCRRAAGAPARAQAACRRLQVARHVWPARRMPCRSLRSTRRAQNQYSSPAQVLASCSRLGGRQDARAAPAQAQGGASKVISAWRATKSSKVLSPSFSSAHPAAGAGGVVGLAALLGAVGQDWLQRARVEPRRRRQLRQRNVDRLARGRHARPPPPAPPCRRRSVAHPGRQRRASPPRGLSLHSSPTVIPGLVPQYPSINVHRSMRMDAIPATSAGMTSRTKETREMWPITSSVLWCTIQWSAPAISRTVRSSQ